MASRMGGRSGLDHLRRRVRAGRRLLPGRPRLGQGDARLLRRARYRVLLQAERRSVARNRALAHRGRRYALVVATVAGDAHPAQPRAAHRRGSRPYRRDELRPSQAHTSGGPGRCRNHPPRTYAQPRHRRGVRWKQFYLDDAPLTIRECLCFAFSPYARSGSCASWSTSNCPARSTGRAA